jgi:hypothetical protein
MIDDAKTPLSDAPDASESAQAPEAGARKREDTKKGKRRQRRSNRPYPPSTFEEAVKFARDIYEFGAGNPVRKLTFYESRPKVAQAETQSRTRINTDY